MKTCKKCLSSLPESLFADAFKNGKAYKHGTCKKCQCLDKKAQYNITKNGFTDTPIIGTRTCRACGLSKDGSFFPKKGTKTRRARCLSCESSYMCGLAKRKKAALNKKPLMSSEHVAQLKQDYRFNKILAVIRRQKNIQAEIDLIPPFVQCEKCQNSTQCAECRKRSSKRAAQVYKLSNAIHSYLKTSHAWTMADKEKVNAWQRTYGKKRRKEDAMLRVKTSLRNRFKGHLKKQSSNKSFISVLGCSLDEFKAHIQSQFKPGMNWNNYGLHTWHIDHKIPIAACTDLESLTKCFHYTNMQPLWASENLTKGKRYEGQLK